METQKIKSTLTTGEDKSNLTLRLWMNIEDREKFILETGRQPKGMINVIILDGKEDN